MKFVVFAVAFLAITAFAVMDAPEAEASPISGLTATSTPALGGCWGWGHRRCGWNNCCHPCGYNHCCYNRCCYNRCCYNRCCYNRCYHNCGYWNGCCWR